MKPSAVLVAMVLAVFGALAQNATNGIMVIANYPPRNHATKLCETSNETFLVTYEYGNLYSVPLTIPPGPPHYDATIQVFKLSEGKRIAVGTNFLGTYVQEGCFEDVPCERVETAKRQLTK